MTIKGKVENDVGVLTIEEKSMGGGDNKKVMKLVHKLISSNITKVILDLSSVTLMSSMGVGTLVACHTMLVKAKGTFVIAAPSEQILNLLEMNKLTNILYISDSVDHAFAKINEK